MKLSCWHIKLIMPSIINAVNFSDWLKFLKSLAKVIRWSKKLLDKIRRKPVQTGPLTRDELVSAEKLLFIQVQWEGFTEEMVALTKMQKNPNKLYEIEKSSPIYDCNPYSDEFGIMRFHGRIDKARVLSKATKRPIILPRNTILRISSCSTTISITHIETTRKNSRTLIWLIVFSFGVLYGWVHSVFSSYFQLEIYGNVQFIFTFYHTYH